MSATNMEYFSRASPLARVEALLDPGSFAPVQPTHAGAVMAGRGCIRGRAVWILATDQSRARGAIGVAEAQAVALFMRTARREPHPVIWILDSAGAKVTEGVHALGAFRELYREALLTCLSGVPMLSVLGRACFGGASLLASLCDRRIYSEQTLLAVSGPGVIQALAGKGQLDAKDPAQVRELMSGSARAGLGSGELLVEDTLDAFRDAVRDWSSAPGVLDLQVQHRRLAERLRGLDPGPVVDVTSALAHLRRLAPPGYVIENRGEVVKARAPDRFAKPIFLGALTGQPVGVELCWLLADELLAIGARGGSVPIVLLLNAAGHAATPRDERLMLSVYLAHLALVASALVQAHHRTVLWLPGAASGASYVAFAAPAERVSALRSSSIDILPRDAVREIVGEVDEVHADSGLLISARVIDGLLDERLENIA